MSDEIERLRAALVAIRDKPRFTNEGQASHRMACEALETCGHGTPLDQRCATCTLGDKEP